MPKCRERLEARLREDGDPRVDQARDRVDGHIAERMQQQIQAEEEEAAATHVARHTGPEAATRVYPQRRRKTPEEIQAQAVRFARAVAEIPADEPPPLIAADDDSDDDDLNVGPVDVEDSDDEEDDVMNNLMAQDCGDRVHSIV